MNKKRWLTEDDGGVLLNYIDPPGMPKVSLRKLRLLVSHYLREIYWNRDRMNGLADAIEEFADGGDELKLIQAWDNSLVNRARIAFGTVAGTRIYARECFNHEHGSRRPMGANLVREVFGNPFRKVNRPSGSCPWFTWNDGTVPTMAREIYRNKGFADLPILADALEDAGCTNVDVLQHLRGFQRCGNDCTVPTPRTDSIRCVYESCGPDSCWVRCPDCKGTGWSPLKNSHVRGCWALDLCLNSE